MFLVIWLQIWIVSDFRAGGKFCQFASFFSSPKLFFCSICENVKKKKFFLEWDREREKKMFGKKNVTLFHTWKNISYEFFFFFPSFFGEKNVFTFEKGLKLGDVCIAFAFIYKYWYIVLHVDVQVVNVLSHIGSVLVRQSDASEGSLISSMSV